MTSRDALLNRLNAIADSASGRPHTLALLGLGSVGTDIARLDEYSDLDFFLIAEPGHQITFIDDLSWLSDVAAIDFSFKNTVDGQKVLFEDGIYAEFAVFAPEDLARIRAERVRVVWAAEDFDAKILDELPPGRIEQHSPDWLLSEILTNLFVGLMRFRRGERLAGFRLVQVHAVDRLLELAPELERTHEAGDTLDPTRRFERRFPEATNSLTSVMQGYERTPESAIAMVTYLKARFAINAAIENRIRTAAEDCYE